MTSIQTALFQHSSIMKRQKDAVDNIERMSLPEHEDIDYELTKAKKDIDSYTKNTMGACDAVKK